MKAEFTISVVFEELISSKLNVWDKAPEPSTQHCLICRFNICVAIDTMLWHIADNVMMMTKNWIIKSSSKLNTTVGRYLYANKMQMILNACRCSCSVWRCGKKWNRTHWNLFHVVFLINDNGFNVMLSLWIRWMIQSITLNWFGSIFRFDYVTR